MAADAERARAFVADAFRAEERFLWGVCYRMTGCAADADDLVQETFARALERPPPDRDRPLRPWLVRVAMNLARDLLRRRRRRAYPGPWLPSPVALEEPVLEDRDGRPLTAEGRYGSLESVSFAFLLALEALTPRQRAVLLLRDVFDVSVREAAAALGVSEDNVKTLHLRARRAMRAYDRARMPPTAGLQARTRDALHRFVAALGARDQAALEALLAAEVRMLSDGGGEFAAARVPVCGRARVARVWVRLAARRTAPGRVRFPVLNGLPAIVAEDVAVGPRDAPRLVIVCGLDGEGRIATMYNVLAPRKLTALAPAGG
jgi:RNA polymerase sigma-70 factor (ECF subfamily)